VPLPRLLAACVLFLALASCRSAPPQPLTWAIAIHGGAGTIAKDQPAAVRKDYEDALAAALSYGKDRLQRGASALDVCEAVVRILEDDPRFNAGKGAVFTEKGEHELDASIMDGSTLRCGAVAGVRTVKNPIVLARLVMEKTRHVLLAGDGAEKFADGQQVERVKNDWFDTDARRRALEQVLEERARTGALVRPSSPQHDYGTVGCVALDAQGRLAAATSTGGMTGKRLGRVGDTPLIGAGNYADRFVAVSCTGTGEQFIRHGVARALSARIEFGRQTLDEAANALVFRVLQPDDGGLIAVDRMGAIAMPFNSDGMYRGCADSAGRFLVRIFAE